MARLTLYSTEVICQTHISTARRGLLVPRMSDLSRSETVLIAPVREYSSGQQSHRAAVWQRAVLADYCQKSDGNTIPFDKKMKN